MLEQSIKYQRIKVVAGSAVGVVENPDNPIKISSSSVVEDQDLNNHLNRGWELIQIITHHSAKHDCTATAFVIGFPIRK
ncbi:MAG: hypothetical protein WC435_01105 [Candidatus Paceibacterota bacterium]